MLAATAGAAAAGAANEAPAADLKHRATVTAFAGPEQNRLACFRGEARPACDLRLYQIMVEAFIDGDPKANHGTGYGTSHHNGDLQGVIDSLDYIQSLGVNAVWLTPIFEVRTVKRQNDWTDRLDATGYYATDYFKIDPRFGTEQQFRTLVDEVHKRGMYIFLDGVFGHYKNNIAASPSGLKPADADKCIAGVRERDYFPDSNTKQACTDYSKPETKAFFNEVIEYWIRNYKIDGWRLDQAYQVPLEQWKEFRATVEKTSASVTYAGARGKKVHPLGYMVAEIFWRDGPPIYNETAYGSTADPALDSAFEFNVRDRLLSAVASEEGNGDADRPPSEINKGFAVVDTYPDHAMPNFMLGNHDTPRLGDLIQRAGLGEPGEDAYWQRHKLAFAFLAAFSGPITVYYGDETGQEVPGFAAKVPRDCAVVGVCEDHVSRSSGKTRDLNPRETDLKNHVARLMRLRTQNPALVVGSRTHVYSDEQVYVDLKKAGKNRVLLAMNTKPRPATVAVDAKLLGRPGALTDLIDGKKTIKASGGRFLIELPPLTARWLRF